jgi:hypothetical protein
LLAQKGKAAADCSLVLGREFGTNPPFLAAMARLITALLRQPVTCQAGQFAA